MIRHFVPAIGNIIKSISSNLLFFAEKLEQPWSNIIMSPKLPMVVLRTIMSVLLLLVPLMSIVKLPLSLLPKNFYQRDLIQEYLLVKSFSYRQELYLPLADLASRLTPDLPVVVFAHPTPHPPPVALFFLPLSLFSFEQAVLIWFFLRFFSFFRYLICY